MLLSTAFASLVAAATQIQLVLAHGGVLSYKIGGVTYNGFVPYNTPVGQKTIQREWDTYDPITNPTDGSIACNKNGANLGSNQLTATVAAGSQVVAYWNPWPHTIGPVMVYMAKCPSTCSSATPSSLSWFKINQSGLLSGACQPAHGEWDSLWPTITPGRFITHVSTIGYKPLKGRSLSHLHLRLENTSSDTRYASNTSPKINQKFAQFVYKLLAIHTSNQPQFYPECAQLKLTGGGSASPSGSYLVKFPGAYSASDPGVTLDIYSQPTVTTYKIPGPAVWSG
ncbi:glycoside hydrolase family 61 protein [Infundibulicybe gibba]|nr:glycoside hydrolase family 61 protein [Infundibulicybe gibba]